MNAERLRDIIKRHEGRRLHPYDDGLGNITIGYGRNLSSVGISPQEASWMLDQDIAAAVSLLDARIGWWRELAEVRQEALVDMAFNMGTGLFTFRRALNYLQAGDYDAAADAVLRGTGQGGRSRWYTQVGRRAEVVSHAIRTGQWTVAT